MLVPKSNSETGQLAANAVEDSLLHHTVETFNHVLDSRAFTCGDRIAFRFVRRAEDVPESITYSELHSASSRIAASLRRNDLQGERIALFLEPGIDFLKAFFGCLLAGSIAVPLPLPRPRRGMQRIHAVFADCSPGAVICTEAVRKMLAAQSDALLLPHGVHLVDDLVAESESSSDLFEVETEPGRLAFLQYTSGSTGTPKGVQVRHRNIVANVRAMADRMACTPEDIGVSWLPHFHDMGLIGGILLPLYAGFETILFPPVSFIEQPLTWLKTISKYRGTISGGPNFAYEMCVKRATDEDLRQLDLSSWRLAFSGSEMVQPGMLEDFSRKFATTGFQRRAWLPCYGLAEATLFVSGRKEGDQYRVLRVDRNALQEGQVQVVKTGHAAEKETVSCGPVAADHEVAIVSPDGLVQLEEGQVGEICVAGPSVTDGYWSRQHEFFETPAAEDIRNSTSRRYLRTGDLGFLLHGDLYVTGRKKDLIILRGMNVYPDDIENAVESCHPAICRAGVAAFPVERGACEHAVVVLEIRREELRRVDPATVFEAVRIAVADELGIQLSAIVAVSQGRIPRTSSGKRQRHQCRHLFEAGKIEGELDRWQIADWRASQASPHTVAEGTGDLESSRADVQGDTTAQSSWMAGSTNRHAIGQRRARRSSGQAIGEEHGASAEPIAVVGMACRFPGANGIQEFERLLATGGSGIREVPGDRWDADALYSAQRNQPGKMMTRWGGFIDGIAQFDAEFFGITPREAKKMDPQQRLLLELSWSALEHAGLSPTDLRGSRTGVFVGIGNSDYTTVNILAAPGFREVDAYSGTGNAHSVAANRVSFTFDLRGPSMAIDTACSSSLVALHYACQSLRTGESELALVGGVNAILSPVVSIAFSNARMLSPDGQCYPFDARANGYVRSEGCGVVALKPLSRATKDGDRILGVIRGTAVNHVGHSTGKGITVPDSVTQRQVILDALRQAGLSPDRLSYVEAHGTGTPVGDPIEMAAISEIFRSAGLSNHPCQFGSVKGNLGHLETASGIASLIKVLLMLERQRIYPQVNFQSLNPAIDLSGTSLAPATELSDWEGHGILPCAGISSFGFGGTNAHAIIERAATLTPTVTVNGNGASHHVNGHRGHGQQVNGHARKSKSARPLHVLTVAAHSSTAFPQVARDYEQLIDGCPNMDVDDFCFSANLTRSRLPYRTTLVANNRELLLAGLRDLIARPLAAGISDPSHDAADRKLAFLCTGQGSQYAGMARQLYETQPAFRASIDRCEQILGDCLGQPLTAILFPTEGSTSLIDRTQYAQPALFSVEWSLAQLWMSWGIQPDVLLGHSVGEYVAACLAGVFTLEDGLRLIAERGRLMGSLSSDGTMAVVMAAEKRIRPLLEEFSDRVSVAAVNGPRLTNISGERAAVEEIMARLSAEKITSKLLNVSEAFHSPLIEPILDEFERFASRINFQPPRVPLVSNVTGQLFDAHAIPDAAYWRRHAREAVYFEQSMKTLAEFGTTIYLEVGPSPNLTSMGRTCVSAGKTRWLPTLRPGHADWEVIGKSVQSLSEAGYEINWHEFERGQHRQRVSLPDYPFQREHHWLDQSHAWYATGSAVAQTHPLLGMQVGQGKAGTAFEASIDLQSQEWLGDHRIYGTAVFPGAAFIEMALSAARLVGGQGALHLEDVSFRQMLALPANESVTLRLEVQPDDAQRLKCQIFSRRQDEPQLPWTLHAVARIGLRPTSFSTTNRAGRGEAADGGDFNLDALRERCPTTVASDEFYTAVGEHGLEYSGAFRCLEQIRIGSGEAVATLVSGTDTVDVDEFCLSPALLDAGLQVLGVAAAACSDTGTATYVPTHMGGITFLARPTGTLCVHARVATVNRTGMNTIRGEVDYLDERGNLCLQVRDVTLTAWGGALATSDASAEPDGSLSPDNGGDGTPSVTPFVINWEQLDPLPLETSRLLQVQGTAHWIILGDRQGLAEQLAHELNEHGQSSSLIFHDEDEAGRPDGSAPMCCPVGDATTLNGTLTKILKEHASTPVRLVHLWSLDVPLLDTMENDEADPFDQATWLTAGSLSVIGNVLRKRNVDAERALLVVTRGGQVVNLAPEETSLLQAATWGAARALGQRMPGSSVCLVDLDAHSHPEWEVASLLTEFLTAVERATSSVAQGGGTGMHEIALRSFDRFAPCLTTDDSHADDNSARGMLAVPADLEYRLIVSADQTIEGLRLDAPQRQAPEAGEVEIEVEAAGVNFSDVLKSLGLYPHDDETVPLGLECCGRVTAVGADVQRFQPGDRVLAMAPHCFSRHVLAPEYGVIACPESLTSAEAAVLPVACTTALYGLEFLGRIQAGERVLIHAASGGVGQAAIRIAQRAGAVIFATAGSPQKRELLREIGVEYVFDSRTDEFANQILEITNGEGVDLVLNSLGGELAARSLSLLKPFGRFIDLAKTDIFQNPWLDRSLFQNNLAYFAVDLDQMYRRAPAIIAKLMARLAAEYGQFRMPHSEFPVTEARQVFRLMANRRHTGKLVLTAPVSDQARSVDIVDPDAVYLLAGEPGSFAVQFCEELQRRGVRSLAMLGVDEQVRHLAGALSGIECLDIPSLNKLTDRNVNVLFFAPGIDGSVETGIGRPAEAAWMRRLWSLHRATLGCLVANFVMIHPFLDVDSAAPGLETFCDGLAIERWQQGRPALSIGLGERGSCPEMSTAGRFIDIVNLALRSEIPQFTAGRFDSASLRERYSQGAPRLLRHLVRGDAERSETPMVTQSLDYRLRTEAAGERRGVLLEHFMDMLARVTSQDVSRIQPQTSIRRLGLDSLMTMELKNSIEAALNIGVNLSILFQDPTIEQLVDYALETWQSTHRQGATAASAAPGAATYRPTARSGEESFVHGINQRESNVKKIG